MTRPLDLTVSQGAILDVVEHPNKDKYPNRIRGYAFLVPFVETNEEMFLKTIIPSRSATRRYLPEESKNEK
jgi:hypothetical protein